MENPFVLAMIEFAVLGTLGEILANLINKKSIKVLSIIYSALVWAVLGVLIKFMFTGFSGFVGGLVSKKYLPDGNFYNAFFKSFFTNALFGPWIIIIHRFLDNLPKKILRLPTKGLKGALLTLLWFWLPAHTVTFLLPEHWQVTLAAVWSFVLGLILGYFSGHSKEENKEEKVESEN
ncbi:MAG: hypothetical protein H7A31_01205 [Thermotogae bacterium]|nr:hypothetical protein [Thermotogota bacterium]HOO75342.1 hypothetical protein [Tepiditoga sp.]